MKIIAVTQARFGSSRLPGKVMKVIDGKTLLEIHLGRIKKSKKIQKIIVATTTHQQDDVIADLAKKLQIDCYRGSEEDVLDRFYQSVKDESPDLLVRLTSDCPLIDSALIDDVIEHAIKSNADYSANIIHPTFPDGLDVEVVKFSTFQRAHREATLKSDREHVMPYLWRNSDLKGGTLFKACSVRGEQDFSKLRLTVDEIQDFELIVRLISAIGTDASWIEYVEYLNSHPELQNLNSKFERNAGMKKSIENEKGKMMLRYVNNFKKSDEYRAEIHDLIPGGAHTYSKGDDQFPARSPAAISHGKGAYVYDLDGNKYLDCSMGLTSVGLGHAYEPVLQRVREELEKGANFQRPAALEREMAKKFLALVPQHQMIKFAKNGSTVTTAATKIARAYTKRKLIAFPGNHPFYSYDDWFIGKTACNLGVPEEIQSLSVTYNAGDLNTLEDLFKKYPNQIACVISEPERSYPANEFSLTELINITHKYGALYIQDEMITGFKVDFPGAISKYKVEPDMATWGKGIANGFAFCALTGKKEFMELGGIRQEGAEKLFLTSTTHGGETHAMAAALATIDIYKNEPVMKHNHHIGNMFSRLCKTVVEEAGLSPFVEIIQSSWFPIFVFKNRKNEICSGMRTLMLQEMIGRGVLFQGSFIPCYSHTESDVQYFAEALKESLEVYKKALEEGYEKYLVGKPTRPVFRKYL